MAIALSRRVSLDDFTTVVADALPTQTVCVELFEEVGLQEVVHLSD